MSKHQNPSQVFNSKAAAKRRANAAAAAATKRANREEAAAKAAARKNKPAEAEPPSAAKQLAPIGGFGPLSRGDDDEKPAAKPAADRGWAARAVAAAQGQARALGLAFKTPKRTFGAKDSGKPEARGGLPPNLAAAVAGHAKADGDGDGDGGVLDEMNAGDSIALIRTIESVEDLDMLEKEETEGKLRSTVLEAVDKQRERLAELAEEKEEGAED